MIVSFHRRDPERAGTYDVTNAAFPYAVLGKLTVTAIGAQAVRLRIRSVGRDPVMSAVFVHVERDRMAAAVSELLWRYLRAIERPDTDVDILPEEDA